MITFPKVMDGYRFLQSRYKFAPGSDVDCFILDRLGKDWVEKCYETVQKHMNHNEVLFQNLFQCFLKDFAYELCVGQNGRVWLSAPTARETVLLLQVGSPGA